MVFATSGPKRPTDVRSLLYRLLYDGLVAIRNFSNQSSSEEQIQLVHYLADWFHKLRVAERAPMSSPAAMRVLVGVGWSRLGRTR
jgi:hypothetical protein